MIKKRSNVSKENWDFFYKESNPWRLDGSLRDLIRIKIINNYFKNKTFKNGVDLACGESYLLDKLNFIKSKKGIDISNNAIQRAKEKYPNIKFYVGNPFLDFSLDQKFEFVSCFEALYYPSTEKERKQALKNILKFGSNEAIFAFSVVTVGINKHRDYFTKENFLKLLSEDFIVLDVITITADIHYPIHLKLIQKLLMLLNKKIAVSLFLPGILNALEKERYQELFICKRKLSSTYLKAV